VTDLSRAIYETTVPIMMVIIIGLFMCAAFFIAGVPQLTAQASNLTLIASNIFAVSMIYAIVSHMSRETQEVVTQKKGWPYKIMLLIMFAAFVIIGLLPGYGPTSVLYGSITTNIMAPTTSAMYGLQMFALLSATAKAFKMRNVESVIMITTAVLYILGKAAPIGLVLWPGFGPIQQWVYDMANRSVTTVIEIGWTTGMTIYGLRIFMGKETGYLTGRGTGMAAEGGG
jgi:hypothetical protein